MDTIFSLITSPVKSSIAVFRLSGQNSFNTISLITKKNNCRNRYMFTSYFYDSNDDVIDYGMYVCFNSHNSYTGEDVVEIHMHGSLPIITRMDEVLCFYGLRQSRRGEFTLRSFLNKKIDLIQAEAVNDLINSKNIISAKKSLTSLIGNTSSVYKELHKDIVHLISSLEYYINFLEDEDKKFILEVNKNIQRAYKFLHKIQKSYSKSSDINSQYTIALVGRTNAGKSSLFNILCSFDRSIVSHVHGTTRDYIESHHVIRDRDVTFIDTAGIRDNYSSFIEKEGICKSEKIIRKAHLRIFVIDNSLDKKDYLPGYIQENDICVFNKIDICHSKNITQLFRKKNQLYISCFSHQGIEGLKSLINSYVENFNMHDDSAYMYNYRHQSIIMTCIKKMNDFLSCSWIDMPEIAILFLHEIVICLEDILGNTTSDDIISGIFSHFCVGK